ncbi:MAG: leucine-rich repeat domain-containing protein [Aureispira sp.]
MSYHKLIRELFYSTIQCNRSLAFELAKSTHCHAEMVHELYTNLLDLPSFISVVNTYDPAISSDLPVEVPTNEFEVKQQCIEHFCNLYFHKKMNLNSYYLSSLIHTPFQRLHTFPKVLLHCVFLEELDLSHNALTTLPDDIGRLYNLKHLNLSSNVSLKTLPVSIGQLQQLESLNLAGIHYLFKTSDGKNPYEFPTFLRHLSNLRHLNLQDVMITALPDWIGAWKHLESLHLFSGNQLHPVLGIPNSFVQLQQLKTLTIDAFTVSLPPTIHQLIALESLVVNHAKELPATIADLQELKYLDLSYLSPQFPLKHSSFATLKELPIGNTDSRLELFGWEWLLKMPHLKEFIYKHQSPYKLTPQDVQYLQKALPNCTFSFE